jgi:hypothetical protein
MCAAKAQKLSRKKTKIFEFTLPRDRDGLVRVELQRRELPSRLAYLREKKKEVEQAKDPMSRVRVIRVPVDEVPRPFQRS